MNESEPIRTPRSRRGAAGRRRPLGLAATAAAALAALSGCAGDAGTEISPSPARLDPVSAEVDTIQVGETTDPPLGVRVESPAGDPVEGVPVRFLVVSGPGRVSEGLAVTNSRGIAENRFEAGSEFGVSRIRADVPSATNVGSLRFRVVTLPAEEVRLSRVGGGGQEAELNSQLPLPFELRVTTNGGVPAGGVRVAWSLVRGEGGSRLAADTTFTDSAGRTENLLTLGSVAGDHVVRAHAGPGVGSDTVRFTAAAVTELSGSVRVDSVAPRPLRPGREAVLFGRGFDGGAGAVEVRVEGVAASTLEATDGKVRFSVPDFSDRCLPEREVGVRALAGAEVSNGILARLRPGEPPLDLAPGDVRILTGAEALECLRFAGSEDARELLLTVGNASRVADAVTPLRLRLRTGGGEPTDAAASLSASVRPPVAAEGGDRAIRDFGAEATLRESSLRALRDQGLRQPRRTGPALPDPRTSEVTARGSLQTGDLETYRFATGPDLSVTCRDTTRTVTGRVRAVGERVVLVQDTAAPPAGGFTDADFELLRDEFDRVVHPTDSAYFGGPADIDGNGRIIVLFTPEVNRLTPRSATGRISGFFLPLDLVDSGDEAGSGLQGSDGQVCPASNEAEILYLSVPDPDGVAGPALPRPEGLRLARSVTAHELAHLLSAEQRLIFGQGEFSDLGTTWLQEGLAHVAEEVVGFRAMDLEAGRDLGWEDVTADRDLLELFNTFHLDNFGRLSLFMQAPSLAPTLATSDPGGIASLQMRGFAWSLLRQVADERAGGDAAGFFRRLSTGGSASLRGVENLESATGAAWEALLTRYLLGVALDEADVEGRASELGLATWNLRSMFAGLAENPGTGGEFVPSAFPLLVLDLPVESSTLDLDLGASTAAYLRLSSVRDAPPAALRLESQNGGAVPASVVPQLNIVRIR